MVKKVRREHTTAAACASGLVVVALVSIPRIAVGTEGETHRVETPLTSGQVSEVESSAEELLGAELEPIPTADSKKETYRSFIEEDTQTTVSLSTSPGDQVPSGAICEAGLASGAAAACDVVQLPSGGEATVLEFATRGVGKSATGPVQWLQVPTDRVADYPADEIRWTKIFSTITDDLSVAVIQYAENTTDLSAAERQFDHDDGSLIEFAADINN